MMTRGKLHEIKSAARKFDFEPSTQLVHSLVDHGLDALTELEGGPEVIEQRAALQERERQVGLALADLGVQLATIQENIPIDLEPAVVDGHPLMRDLDKARYTIDAIREMLKAKGPQWNREWAHYQPRIEEEFDA
jgi:hypothetical protein